MLQSVQDAHQICVKTQVHVGFYMRVLNVAAPSAQGLSSAGVFVSEFAILSMWATCTFLT